jgi:hypothetical protein
MDLEALELEADGAQYFPGAVSREIEALHKLLVRLPMERAGFRISGLDGLAPYLTAEGAIGIIAARILGRECRAVRAVLFDKTEGMNWALGWHQDRTICEKARRDVDGFGPWTTKGGIQHVAPPFEILKRMVTLRVHIDDVPIGNAPLLIATGSHRQLVPVTETADIVQNCRLVACVAAKGDVWAYSTPILHASNASAAPGRRRVLQVDFSGETLPQGLEWYGV